MSVVYPGDLICDGCGRVLSTDEYDQHDEHSYTLERGARTCTSCDLDYCRDCVSAGKVDAEGICATCAAEEHVA